MTKQDGSARRRGHMPLGRWLPLLLLAAFTAFALWQGWHRYLSIEALVEHRAALDDLVARNLVFALAGFTAIYAAAVALSLPGAALLTMTGGLLFGWLLGGLAAILAATAGATLVFLIARTSLGAAIAERSGRHIEKLREGFRRDAMSYLLFLRLVPLFPFWLVNLAPALLGVPLAIFVAATAIGIVPGTFAFAFVGAGLDSVIDAQAAALAACREAARTDCGVSLGISDVVTPQILLALGALGVVALLPIVLRRLRAGKAAPSARGGA